MYYSLYDLRGKDRSLCSYRPFHVALISELLTVLEMLTPGHFIRHIRSVILVPRPVIAQMDHVSIRVAKFSKTRRLRITFFPLLILSQCPPK
jgi:hypothetical protein